MKFERSVACSHGSEQRRIRGGTSSIPWAGCERVDGESTRGENESGVPRWLAEGQPSPIHPPAEGGRSGYARRQAESGHPARNVEQYLQSSRLEVTMRYAIVIEKSETGYGAYVPDLPGCVAVGETVEDTEQLMREAIEFHLEGMRADGVPIPEPTTRTDYVEIA